MTISRAVTGRNTDIAVWIRAADVELDPELVPLAIDVKPRRRRFVSSAHTGEDSERTIQALDEARHANGGSP